MKHSLKTISILMLILLILTGVFAFSGCREVERVSYNLSKEADAFNVIRQLTVINVRSDDVLFQMTGKMSIANSKTNELEVVVEDENGVYHKHFIYLNDWITYVVEDVSGATVSKYKYTLNYNPKMWDPSNFEIKTID